MEKKTFVLSNDRARQLASVAVMKAPENYVCEIKEPTRSLLLNAKLHATLSDISNQIAWHGKKLDIDTWKRLCMAAWLREINEQPMLIPALDGWGVDIVFEKTSKLTQKQCSSLLEWIHSFGAEHNVRWSAPSYYQEN